MDENIKGDSVPQNANLRLVQYIKNIETGHYKGVVKFDEISGDRGRVLLSSDDLSNERRLHDALHRAGVKLPKLFDEAKPQLLGLMKQHCDKVKLVTSRNGWHIRNGKRTYVAGPKSYGDEPDLRLETVPDNMTVGMQAGDLQSLTKGIEPLVRCSRPARFTLALGCAGILSGLILMQESFVTYLKGQSGGAKTLAASLAPIMLGRATKKDLRTTKASDSGFERLLAMNSHSAVVTDEIKASGGDGLKAFQLFEERAFIVAAGGGKTIADKNSGLGTISRKIDALLIATGEVGIDELAGDKGAKLGEGGRRRLMQKDILPRDKGGICDLKPKWTLEQKADARRKAKQAITENYGVQLPIFVKWLLRRKDLEGTHKTEFEDFVKHFRSDDNWEEELVSKFAYVCSAGVMGCRAGIIPLKPALMRATIKKLCEEELKKAAASSLNGEKLLRRLFDACQDKKRCPFVLKGDPHMLYSDSSLGFKRDQAEATLLFIGKSNLRDFLGSEASRWAMLEFCVDKGMLVYGADRAWDERLGVPDGSKKRLHRLRWGVIEEYFEGRDSRDQEGA